MSLNNRQYRWGANKNKRKRCHSEDSDDYDEVVGHPKVRCVGNRIYFNCAVDDSSVGELVRLIEQKNFEFKMIRSHELVGYIEPAPLYLHLNTDGGIIFSAMWAVDTIMASLVPIYTVVNGRAASAGSIISVVGKKRFMTKHSYMLIHQLRSGVVGKYNDIEQEYQNCNQLMDSITDIYTNHSKLTKEKVRELLNKDHYWDLETCLEYGLIDGVWENEGKGRPIEITLEQLLALAQQESKAEENPDDPDPDTDASEENTKPKANKKTRIR